MLSLTELLGPPWLIDPMKEQEAEAIAHQKTQKEIEDKARKQQLQGAAADPTDDEDPDTPELVR